MPLPLLSLTLSPKTAADRERLDHGLRALAGQDPTLHVTSGPASGDTVIGGVGELHLEIVLDRLNREFGVSASVTQPRVVYKEARFAQVTILLEPVMRVEVVLHQQHLDAIVADLVERRGWIGSREERAGMHIVCAFVPLANLFGYMSYLREATRGQGSFTMQFDRYDPVD